MLVIITSGEKRRKVILPAYINMFIEKESSHLIWLGNAEPKLSYAEGGLI